MEGGQDSLVKMGQMGWGSLFEGQEAWGSKQSFSLIMFAFCSGNALYTAILSFRLFIFLLAHFDTRDFDYFGCL